MSVRRSGKLTAKSKASNPTVQAQNVLMQKLGVVYMTQRPDPEALDTFKTIFVAPLSASKQEALRALFGTNLDPVAIELDLTGLEDDAL